MTVAAEDFAVGECIGAGGVLNFIDLQFIFLFGNKLFDNFFVQ